jgi:hypothetical protein
MKSPKDIWRAPKFLVRPKVGPIMLKAEVNWNLVLLPASTTKGGWEGRAESSGIRLGRGTLLIYSVLHPKPTTSWLELILHPFGVGTSRGRPWIHLTHHGPGSGEATTFPHIVFSMLLHRAHARMLLCPGTLKVESRNYPGWTPETLGVHNFSHQPSIGTRSKANL